MASSEIMINNINKFLSDMERESNIEEDMILQGMNPNAINELKKKYQEDVLNEIYKDIQNDDVLEQQLIIPEMMNKYIKNYLMKMEPGRNNQKNVVIYKPNLEDVIRQKMLRKVSHRIDYNF